MSYLITPTGNKKIEGKYNKVLFENETLTSGQLAKKIGVSSPCVSVRMTKCIKNINSYEDVVNPDKCISLFVTINNIRITSTDLMKETGQSRSYITRKIHKFNNGEIDENELRMPSSKITTSTVTMVVAPRVTVAQLKERQTNAERNEDYKRQLRMHKMNTYNQTVGAY